MGLAYFHLAGSVHGVNIVYYFMAAYVFWGTCNSLFNVKGGDVIIALSFELCITLYIYIYIYIYIIYYIYKYI